MGSLILLGIVLYIVSVLVHKATGKKYWAVLTVIIPIIMLVFVGMNNHEFDASWMAGPGADIVSGILIGVTYSAFVYLIYKAVKSFFVWLLKKIGKWIKGIFSK